MEIDIDRLRRDLDDYFTAAYFNVSELALMDMIDVESASPERLIELARRNGFDLSRYEIQESNPYTYRPYHR